MTVFPVAMGGLIFIHKIHINGIVGNFFVKLRVQLEKRLSEFL